MENEYEFDLQGSVVAILDRIYKMLGVFGL